ncbi:zinc phosphodiesterase ELAC protein 1 [Erpetoichthys calabaricus]|uniref:ElaC ribonuclease Z 1 n=1 Tax=Erpetoichthys calabaricus TaxID=27687 RepID=A0A8C4RSZ7_ERPCA|nr:zinc phosphodiesterase ELAC protein 1 [Erpetoichthys calabaricus]
MSMELVFLGTGAAYPSPYRSASALVLRTEGDCWLFDCGEGTQTQLMRSHLKAGRITKIFITHLHGDHMFGLPGLLCTLSLNCSTTAGKEQQPVHIYGPAGLRKFLRVSLELSNSQLLFPYIVHEFVPTADQSPTEGMIDSVKTECDGELHPQEQEGRTIYLDPEEKCYTLLENEQFVVKAFRLYHRIPSFGFTVQERERPGRLNVEKLKELGVRPGPAYGKLKNGESVVLENGVTVHSADVVQTSIPGRKVCILGDCSGLIDDAVQRLCWEADVLVHEATLDDTQKDKALEHGHSTPSMAADFANSCQAKQLVLNHFSQRYKPSSLLKDDDENNIMEMKLQAASVFKGNEVIIAEDFLSVGVPIKKKS